MKRWIHAATNYADNSDLGGISDRWNIADTTDDPKVLERLSNDEMNYLRAAVARNKYTPVDILAKLADDVSKDVRYNVAINSNTPSNVLIKLADDFEYEVRAGVARNESTPAEFIVKLASDENKYVRNNANNNPNNPNPDVALNDNYDESKKRSSWQLILDQLNDEIEEIDPLYEQTEVGSYILSLCNAVEESLNYYVEPSVQAGMGGVWIYDEANDNNVIVEDYDFDTFNTEIIELALNSKNKTDFKKKYKEYLLSLH